MQLSQEKFNSLIIDLLINLTVEQEALRNLMAGEYIRHTKEDVNELNEALRELRVEARKSIMAQIQNNFGMDDIQGLIDSALK